MLKFTRRMFNIYVGVILSFLLFHTSFGQIQNKNILDQEINLNIERENIFQVCSALAYFEKIPIGLEGATDFDIGKSNKSIQIKRGTLREILDLLVKQEPNYKWEVQNGVVNIYPIHLRDEILKTFLEIKIRNFSLKKELGRTHIAHNINGLEEINKYLNSQQIRLNIGIYTKSSKESEVKDIDISNTNLRDVLNKVVKDSNDSKLWLVKRNNNGEIFLVF